GVVWRWRKALGVTRTGSEGSRRLIRTAAGGRRVGHASTGADRRGARGPGPDAGPVEPGAVATDRPLRAARPSGASGSHGTFQAIPREAQGRNEPYADVLPRAGSPLDQPPLSLVNQDVGDEG